MTRRNRPDRDRRRRGQTTQDFAIGVSVFLLTIAFVFAFVPTIFTPFSSEVPPGAAQQADRVASKIVDEYSRPARENWLANDFTSEVVGNTSENLADRFGLPGINDVNVTISKIDGDRNFTTIASAGESSEGFSTASVSRLVVIEGLPQCRPGGAPGKICRLVVEVW